MGGDRICKKLMTMQIQVYVEMVPPFANETSIENIDCKQMDLAKLVSLVLQSNYNHKNQEFTCVIEDSPPCPVLDNHGERADSGVDGDIGLDHFCVQESQRCVDVHVAREVPS